MKRGDIYYANLMPTVKSEHGGTLPVLILQNDAVNRYSSTVIVAAITSMAEKKRLPTHVALRGGVLFRDSVVMLEQLHTIDRTHLREYMGGLDSAFMNHVDKTLANSLGLPASAG